MEPPLVDLWYFSIHWLLHSVAGKEIHVRECTSLSKGYLYATTPRMFEGASEVSFNRVRDQVSSFAEFNSTKGHHVPLPDLPLDMCLTS